MKNFLKQILNFTLCCLFEKTGTKSEIVSKSTVLFTDVGFIYRSFDKKINYSVLLINQITCKK